MTATRERVRHLSANGRQALTDCAQPRINFARVQRACAKTGMRLRSSCFLGARDTGRPDNCGCPLAILYVARFGYPVSLAESGCDWEPNIDPVDRWARDAFGLSYAAGFMAGFDYTACPHAGSYGDTQRNALFTAGYRDGAAVFHRARRAGLIGEAAA